MSALLFFQLMTVILAVALIICFMMIQQLQKELEKEKGEKQRAYLTFSFEGPEQRLSIKNVGVTPVSMVTIQDLSVTLLLEYQKTVVLKFEQVPILDPRESAPLKFRIWDGGFAMPADAQNSFAPHLKGSAFEAHVTYRDWQNVPAQAIIVKEGDRFFTKAPQPLQH
jgi:hypothetical protein